MKIVFEKRPPKRRKKAEFSKIILAAVMIIFIAVAALGGYIVFNNPEQLGEYLAFIGAPTATAIGFYAWKAKNENVKKIGRKEDDDNADS